MGLFYAEPHAFINQADQIQFDVMRHARESLIVFSSQTVFGISVLIAVITQMSYDMFE